MKKVIVYLGGALYQMRHRSLVSLTGLKEGQILAVNVAADLVPVANDLNPRVVIVSTVARNTLETVEKAKKAYPEAMVIVRGSKVDGLDDDIPVVKSESGIEGLLPHFPSPLG